MSCLRTQLAAYRADVVPRAAGSMSTTKEQRELFRTHTGPYDDAFFEQVRKLDPLHSGDGREATDDGGEAVPPVEAQQAPKRRNGAVDAAARYESLIVGELTGQRVSCWLCPERGAQPAVTLAKPAFPLCEKHAMEERR